MVLQLEAIFEEDNQSGKNKQIGVKAQFKKDRAAFNNPRRAVKFDLNSHNFKEDIEQSIKDGCNL